MNFIATKTHEFHDEVVNVVIVDNMGDLEANVFDSKLAKVMIHMKHQMLIVLQPFPSFLHVFYKKRCHNMLAFMLDPRFKSLQLMINYVGREVAYALVVQYKSNCCYHC